MILNGYTNDTILVMDFPYNKQHSTYTQLKNTFDTLTTFLQYNLV